MWQHPATQGANPKPASLWNPPVVCSPPRLQVFQPALFAVAVVLPSTLAATFLPKVSQASVATADISLPTACSASHACALQAADSSCYRTSSHEWGKSSAAQP